MVFLLPGGGPFQVTNVAPRASHGSAPSYSICMAVLCIATTRNTKALCVHCFVAMMVGSPPCVSQFVGYLSIAACGIGMFFYFRVVACSMHWWLQAAAVCCSECIISYI